MRNRRLKMAGTRRICDSREVVVAMVAMVVTVVVLFWLWCNISVMVICNGERSGHDSGGCCEFV